MKKVVASPLIIVSIFLWIGFVLAISFMEAWLKFQAPGITVPLGLGIGRLVFGALNKVELLLCLIVLISLLRKPRQVDFFGKIIFIIPVIILALQSFYLLPLLDARAELYINGTPPAESLHHITYIVTEFIKVTCLAIFGVKQFK